MIVAGTVIAAGACGWRQRSRMISAGTLVAVITRSVISVIVAGTFVVVTVMFVVVTVMFVVVFWLIVVARSVIIVAVSVLVTTFVVFELLFALLALVAVIATMRLYSRNGHIGSHNHRSGQYRSHNEGEREPELFHISGFNSFYNLD